MMSSRVFAALFASLLCFSVSAGGSSRSVKIVNQCSSDYWMQPISGSAPYSSGKSACYSNSDCISGSTCDTTNKLCFWSLPTTSTGNFRISAKSSNTLDFPYVNNGNDVLWSGNIGFCQSGTCGPSTSSECDANGCGVYAGPNNIAEFTMSKTGTDFYDISIIGGVNVPMEFAPVLTTATYSTSAPYTCGKPGSPSNSNGEWQSSWKFSAPSVYNNWVTSGGAACTESSTCGSGKICGLTNNVGSSPQFKLTCGESLGYWSANTVCAQDQSIGAPFNCKQQLGSPNSGMILDNLIRCDNGISSCYQPNPPTSCCGCANWNSILGSTVSPADTQQCGATNPNWVQYVQPQLKWLKSGCPSCYTYPYDDMSSTFVCSQKSNGYNNIDYTITLCP